MDNIQLDKHFSSFVEFEEALKKYHREQCANLYKKEARTIEAGRKKAPNKTFNEDLVYSEFRYACVHNGKSKQKLITGERANNQKTTKPGVNSS